MNPAKPRRRTNGFTLVEMLVVIVTIAVSIALILPALTRAKAKSGPRSCTLNLKQVGLAFSAWAIDNNDSFPMQVYTNKDGGMQYADQSNFFRYFQVLSNELNNTRTLICPADLKKAAQNFGSTFNNANISYFLGLDAREGNPTNILSGDRNIANGLALRNGILDVTTNRPAGWTSAQHNGGGNILLSDGSVQQVTSSGLQQLIARSGLVTNRLAIP